MWDTSLEERKEKERIISSTSESDISRLHLCDAWVNPISEKEQKNRKINIEQNRIDREEKREKNPWKKYAGAANKSYY